MDWRGADNWKTARIVRQKYLDREKKVPRQNGPGRMTGGALATGLSALMLMDKPLGNHPRALAAIRRLEA